MVRMSCQVLVVIALRWSSALAARADPGISAVRISVYAGNPDMVVPGESVLLFASAVRIRADNLSVVGEAPYTSTITGQTEYLPVTISFMAAKGCVSLLPLLAWLTAIVILSNLWT